MAAPPPWLSLLLLLVRAPLASAQQCIDSESTPFRINGAPADCPMLASSCQHETYGCTISSTCPSTCGACDSRFFCDSDYTGIVFDDGSATSCAADLSGFCDDATFGSHIRLVCGETCGCGQCPPLPPPAPPLSPSCHSVLDLAIVVDLSASMRGQPIIRFVREIVLQFTVEANATRVGVVGFSDSARVLAPLDADLSFTLAAVDNITTPMGHSNVSHEPSET